MHHFIYATKDTWISSGSNTATTGTSERDQNYGQDSILELKKNFYNDQLDYQTRIITTPCSKFPDSFLKTHGVGGTIPDVGFTEVIIEGDGTIFIHPLVAKPKITLHKEDIDKILGGRNGNKKK